MMGSMSTTAARHRTLQELSAHVDLLRAAPPVEGTLDLVVRRPANGEREILDEAVVDEDGGLLGDNWLSRATRRGRADGRHLDSQITVMSSRMVGLLGDTDEERAGAGDQLYVDLDLSHANLPAGSRLAIGDTVVIEVSAKPHAGCKKFLNRFGRDSVTFVNSQLGKELRLRGLNARVVTGGVVRPGDSVRKL